MISRGSVGEVPVQQDSFPVQIHSPMQYVIDQQLEELLSSLERDQEAQHTVQIPDVQTPCAETPTKNRKTIGRSSRLKRPAPRDAVTMEYTSDGNSDILSCDSSGLSPGACGPVLSPTALCEGLDGEVSSTSGRGGAVPGATWPEHPLPPCRICGDRASGFHYGANTCEACKVRDTSFRSLSETVACKRMGCSGAGRSS